MTDLLKKTLNKKKKMEKEKAIIRIFPETLTNSLIKSTDLRVLLFFIHVE